MLGGILAGVALFTVGGVVLAVMLTGGKSPPSRPVVERRLPGGADSTPAPANLSPASSTSAGSTQTPASLNEAARDKVKKATVYLRVTNADGSVAAGTGFFGTKEARNVILTNAHVVGMLAPESPRPRKVEVFINSGESDERQTTARILSVDRSSDLAVLDVGTTDNMPEPLHVKSAKGLHELDPLFVFGFPLGESLGKEITIRPSSVSSLRRKAGQLNRVQVNGGMDPGSSGGPVVDPQGHVVGVAVSGIPGRMINFAIPGDRVHIILNGRIASFTPSIPFRSGSEIHLPVSVELIDPRGKVREAGVDLWTGEPPENAEKSVRPAAVSEKPSAEEGDSPRQHFTLTEHTNPAEVRGNVSLPELLEGKVYWYQPVWVDADGVRHWDPAMVLSVKPEDAVERTQAWLAARFHTRTTHPLTLTIQNTFKLSGEDDELMRLRTRAVFEEEVLAAHHDGGAILRLRYSEADSQITTPNKPPLKNPALEAISDHMGAASAVLEVDAAGNLVQNVLTLDKKALLASHSEKGIKLDTSQAARVQQNLSAFHQPIRDGLECLAIRLPGEVVKPGQTWTGTRTLPLDTPGLYESGEVNLSYTYVGQRKQKDHDQAVILLSGIVRGRGKKASAVSGRATGQALLDLATGQVTLAEIKVTGDRTLALPGKDRETEDHTIRVIATQVVRLERQI